MGFAEVISLIKVLQVRYFMRKRDQKGVRVQIAIDRDLRRMVLASHSEVAKLGSARFADLQFDAMGCEPIVDGVYRFFRNVLRKSLTKGFFTHVDRRVGCLQDRSANGARSMTGSHNPSFP